MSCWLNRKTEAISYLKINISWPCASSQNRCHKSQSFCLFSCLLTYLFTCDVSFKFMAIINFVDKALRLHSSDIPHRIRG